MPLLSDTPQAGSIQPGDITPIKRSVGAGSDMHIDTELLVGPQGDQGIQGDPGTDGADGGQGIQGEEGPIGPQGIQGDQGDQGDQGIQGIQGEQGLPGIDGEDGATGPQGDAGPQGVQGDKGDKGDQGDPGLAEIKWSYYNASVTANYSARIFTDVVIGITLPTADSSRPDIEIANASLDGSNVTIIPSAGQFFTINGIDLAVGETFLLVAGLKVTAISKADDVGWNLFTGGISEELDFLAQTDVIGGNNIGVDYNIDGTVTINHTSPISFVSIWNFEEGTSPPPTTGRIRADSTQWQNADNLFLHAIDDGGIDRTDAISQILVNDTIIMNNQDDDVVALYRVVDEITDEGDWFNIPVVFTAGNNDNPDAGDPILVTWFPQSSLGYVPEAPDDGQTYVRRNKQWFSRNNPSFDFTKSILAIGEAEGIIHRFKATSTVIAERIVGFDGDATYGIGVSHASNANNIQIAGVALNGGSAGDDIDVIVEGKFRGSITLTNNFPVYVSGVDGSYSNTVPGSGEFAKLVGQAGLDDVIFVKPQSNWAVAP